MRSSGVGHRIGVITDDVLTSKMAGPAIRAWQIASALAREHEVRLVTTSSRCELSSATFDVADGTGDAVRQTGSWADVVVVQGAVLGRRRFLRTGGKVIVVDLYDPLHLEQLELHGQDDPGSRWAAVGSATAELNAQVARGDFFLCASAKQRDLWLGHLAALGRVNPRTYDEDSSLFSLIDVVPFGLPSEPARHTETVLRGVVPGIGPEDEVILWGGGVYNWLDPLTLIRAVDILRLRRPKARLFFLGLQHPNPNVPAMHMAAQTRALAGELGLVGTHVFFNDGWVPYDERQSYLLEADVGVSTHLDHVETAFSFRTRILDYIWAGLPVVATEGDAFADVIRSRGLGLTVPPGDAPALAQALHSLLADTSLAETCRQRLSEVRPAFAWDEALRPLLRFCADPRRAPDLAGSASTSSLRRPAGVPASLWPGWGRDARVAVRHLGRGDLALLSRKLATRLRRPLDGTG